MAKAKTEKRNDVKQRQPKSGAYPMYGDVAGVTVNADTLQSNITVMSCVKTIASTIGSLSGHVYERLADGSRRTAYEHPQYRVWHTEPNPEMSAMSYWETVVTHLLLRGNYYGEDLKNNGGDLLKANFPILPDAVVPSRMPDGSIWYRVFGNKPEYLPSTKILHIPAFGFDGLIGYDPVTVIRRAAGVAMAAETFGEKFFANNAQLGGYLSTDKALTETEFKNIKKTYEEIHSGVGNAFRFALLHGGLKWEQLGVSPDNGQWLETRKFQQAEIAGWFSVPLFMLNNLEKSTLNNMEEMSAAFVQNCLRPICERIEQAINRRYFNDGRFYFEFDMSSLLRGNTAARTSYYKELSMIGAISNNQICQRENLPPIGAEGDLRWVPLNSAPMQLVIAKYEAEIDKIKANTEAIRAQNAALQARKEGSKAPENRAEEAQNPGLSGETGPENALVCPQNPGFSPQIRAEFSPKTAFSRLFVDVFTRAQRKESKALATAYTKFQKSNDAEGFVTWRNKFYADLTNDISENLEPVAATYQELTGETIDTQAVAESYTTMSIEDITTATNIEQLLSQWEGKPQAFTDHLLSGGK